MTATWTLTGRHVLLIFLAFFIIVTGVNVLMVTFALKTFSGEDVSGAYAKGLNYNATLDDREAEARSGYAIEASAARDGGRTIITAHVTRQGTALPDALEAAATLRHPANAHLDRTVALSRKSDGVFSVDLDDVPAGQWDVVIALHLGADTVYEASTRTWLR